MMLKFTTVVFFLSAVMMGTGYGNEISAEEMRARIANLAQENRMLQQERDQNQIRLDEFKEQYANSAASRLGNGVQRLFHEVTTQAKLLWVTSLSPGRLALFQKLANSPHLPKYDDLRLALDELGSLIEATGHVGTASLPVIQGDGHREVQDVMFVGPFAVSSNDNFLLYQPEIDHLVTATWQPSMVTRLHGASFRSRDRTALALDPLHGGLLREQTLQPGIWQQVAEGGALLWVIFLLMAGGLVLVGWYALFVHREIRNIKDHYWYLLAMQKERTRSHDEDDAQPHDKNTKSAVRKDVMM